MRRGRIGSAVCSSSGPTMPLCQHFTFLMSCSLALHVSPSRSTMLRSSVGWIGLEVVQRRCCSSLSRPWLLMCLDLARRISDAGSRGTSKMCGADGRRLSLSQHLLFASSQCQKPEAGAAAAPDRHLARAFATFKHLDFRKVHQKTRF